MVSKPTGLIIQNNTVYVSTYQDNQSRMWCFKISWFDRGKICPLLDSPVMYASKTIAKEKGDGLVNLIRKIDFNQKVEIKIKKGPN